MKKGIAFLLLLSAAFAGRAQHRETYAGARSLALGNASLCLSDAWSAQNNVGALGFIKHTAGAVYMESRFSMKELSRGAFTGALKTKDGVFSLNGNYFGYSRYNEQNVGLGFSRTFGPSFSAGIKFHYFNTNIQEYGRAAAFTAEAGIAAKLNKQITVGFNLFNPFMAKIKGAVEQKLPVCARLGLLYTLSEQVLISSEIGQELTGNPSLKLGIEYKPRENFTLRTGAGTAPFLYSFGFGWLPSKNMQVDMAAAYHQYLGFSPAISLVFTADRK